MRRSPLSKEYEELAGFHLAHVIASRVPSCGDFRRSEWCQTSTTKQRSAIIHPTIQRSAIIEFLQFPFSFLSYTIVTCRSMGTSKSFPCNRVHRENISRLMIVKKKKIEYPASGTSRGKPVTQVL